jgi:prepilin-type N-terminal cleavage/methylation domain-containing protein
MFHLVPTVRGASVPVRPRSVRSSGFTLIELMVVVGIMAVAAGMAVLVMPTALKAAKADGELSTVVGALRTAREQAISQRRNIRVTFTSPNQIAVLRESTDGTSTTLLNTIYLGDSARFLVFSENGDTPDAFGNGSAVAFGTAANWKFSSDGTFVDQNGDPLNGSVFIGRYNEPLSARAVTIFGPTALIRQWRWDGRQWTN